MLVSEAIRLGAMLRPQAFMVMFAWDYQTQTYKSCAIGAMAEASGEQPDLMLSMVDYVESTLLVKFPALALRVNLPPCDCVPPGTSANVRMDVAIAHLNDAHQWTRERIADWIATVETVPVEVVEVERELTAA